MADKTKQLQLFFKLLSNDNKMKIIRHLMQGEQCVCNMAEHIQMEQSLVSHHLTSLRDAGLVKNRRVGNWIHVSLNKDVFTEMQTTYQSLLNPSQISEIACTNPACCSKSEC